RSGVRGGLVDRIAWPASARAPCCRAASNCDVMSLFERKWKVETKQFHYKTWDKPVSQESRRKITAHHPRPSKQDDEPTHLHEPIVGFSPAVRNKPGHPADRVCSMLVAIWQRSRRLASLLSTDCSSCSSIAVVTGPRERLFGAK